MKYIFVFFIFILLAIGCGQQSQSLKTFKGQYVHIDSVKSLTKTNQNLKVIDLSKLCDNKQYTSLFPLLDDYRLVILETTDNCLIGEIRKVVLADSLIFIHDPYIANKLFLYNNKGKFIRQIGAYGQGPGEYIQVSDFYYDKNTGEILLYDQFKSTIMYFDIDGKHIKNKKQLFRYINFTKIGEEYVYKNLIDNEHIPAVNESYITVGTDSIPVKYAFLPKLEMDYLGEGICKINDTTVAFCIPFFDTVYHYRQGVLSAEYLLKLPQGKRLPSNFQKISNYSSSNLRGEFPPSKYMYYRGEFLENNDYFQCIISAYSNRYTFLYNKSNKEITGGMISWNPVEDEFEKMLLFHPFISNAGDYFISAIQPDKVCEYIQYCKNPKKEETLVKYPELRNITEDDNPLLFIFRLKND
ncbi:MAG: 6-bladed beta-propeller [Bacteroidales bacterium]|jgi:hypothetical protein|nr:6-bladed beta-propeller [Bacteroidales bacterium]